MEQIIEDAVHSLFTSQGISRFTMDELSAKLGISKKTLYRFYPSRQELVEKVSSRVAMEYEAAMQRWDSPEISNLEKLLGLISNVVSFCKKINPDYFVDMERHYPAYSLELHHKLETTLKIRVQQILEAGVQEGVFRNSLHPALVISIWQKHLEKDYEYAAQLVNDYSKDEVFRQAIYLFLYGVIAPAAIPKLDTLLLQYDWKQPLAIPYH